MMPDSAWKLKLDNLDISNKMQFFNRHCKTEHWDYSQWQNIFMRQMLLLRDFIKLQV